MSMDFVGTLKEWIKLNDALRETGRKALTEKQLQDLLIQEQNGKARRSFLQRIYGRLTVVRAQREKRALKIWKKG